jgi:hypothetical protein
MTGLVILGDAAATGAAASFVAAGDAVPAAFGFSATVSCFLHIEKLSASSNGRIANRIIIKVLRD